MAPKQDAPVREPADSSPWTSTVLRLLEDWGHRAEVAAALHYRIAARLSRFNVLLGVPVVIFSTFVGTAVFATLQKTGQVPFKILVGMVSVAAALLASLQTFLRFAERAEKHRVAGTHWAAIRREISEMIALHPTYPESRGDPKTYLDHLRDRFDKLAAESPEMGESAWARARRKHQGAPGTLPQPVEPAGPSEVSPV